MNLCVHVHSDLPVESLVKKRCHFLKELVNTQIIVTTRNTVNESLLEAIDLGFLPESGVENVTVLHGRPHGSHLANLSERLPDLCVESGDNLFVIDVGTSSEEEYVQRQ